MKKMLKYAYIIVGFVSLFLGLIGVFFPILPTTPFLLLTSFCFVKGSDKFDQWFKGTKIYKEHLESFVENRAMTLKEKLSILLFADFMLAFPFFILDKFYVKLVIIILVIFKYTYFFTCIKTIDKEDKSEKKKVS